jgi:MoxR-like ATPase
MNRSCFGHLLVEGPPGLAKTRAIHSLSRGLCAQYHRIQFTPDLLPSDLTGTDIYRSETGQFQFEAGPIFHNLILADEINRAPAKVQSALLEAMAERQVTVGKKSYPLEQMFMVMATQNPLENEGTYPLPEAQLDRFLLHLKLEYPNADTELKILHLSRQEAKKENPPHVEALTQDEIFKARQETLNLHLDPSLEQYIIQLVMATRAPEKYDAELGQWIQYGVSPRATIAIERCARARAWLHGRDFITPEDIQSVVPNVFRHRIVRSYHAEAQEIDCDQITQKILTLVAVS